MKISSRFTIAVHIVLAIALVGGKQKMTSDFLASCINVNPVVIRRIFGQLKRAEIIDVKSGEGGAFLLKDISDLSLFDIYQAVEVVEDVSLFNYHRQPDADCPVNCPCCPKSAAQSIEDGLISSSSNGVCCHIHTNIDKHLQSAQKAMEDSLKETTIQQIFRELAELSTQTVK